MSAVRMICWPRRRRTRPDIREQPSPHGASHTVRRHHQVGVAAVLPAAVPPHDCRRIASRRAHPHVGHLGPRHQLDAPSRLGGLGGLGQHTMQPLTLQTPDRRDLALLRPGAGDAH